MNEQKLLNIKSQIEDTEKKISNLDGQLSTYKKRLKEEFNINNIEQAKLVLDQLIEHNKKNKIKLDEDSNKLIDKYKDLK